MTLRHWLSFLFCFIAACALGLPGPYGYSSTGEVPPATCRTTYRGTYDASSFQDPTEQAQIVKAVDAWRAFSEGLIDVTLTFEPDPAADGQVIRKLTTDPDAIAYNNDQIQKGNIPAGNHVLGWTTGHTVHLIVNDTVDVDHLYILAEHELGHAVGLHWSYCLETHSDCIHSPDPHAVMAKEFSGAPELTPSDLALCRASCLCP